VLSVKSVRDEHGWLGVKIQGRIIRHTLSNPTPKFHADLYTCNKVFMYVDIHIILNL
jgi:hypothetical protein